MLFAFSGPALVRAQETVALSTVPAGAGIPAVPDVVEASTPAAAGAAAEPVPPGPFLPAVRGRSLFLDDISEGMTIFNSFFRMIDREISGNVQPGVNKTALTMQAKAVTSRYDGFRLIPRVDLRVDMPKTLRRLKLVLEHSPEEDSSISASEERIVRGQAPGERTSIGANLKFLLNRFLEEDVRVGSQLRIGRRRPFIIFVKSRLGADAELSEKWKARAFAQAGWYSDPWLKLSCGVYLSRVLPRNATLSFNSSAETPTNDRKIDLFQTVALTKRLSRTDSIGLAGQLHSVNVPVDRAEVYAVFLPYRRNLYNAWFYGELAPGITYARTHSFKADPNAYLNLSMRFGGW